MPLSTKPCTTRECQEAALAAIKAQKEGPASPAATAAADGGAARASPFDSKPGAAAPGASPRVTVASPPGTPAHAAGSSGHRTAASPPGTPPAAFAGQPGVPVLAGLAAGPANGGMSAGAGAGPASPNRTVRFSDEEERALDNLHVGLKHGQPASPSRSSSADSLHRSYDAAAERREGSGLPPSAGGFHVMRTAGGRLDAVSSSARWEDVVGYSRAVKRGPFVYVSGTSAVDQETGRVMFRRDAYKQTQLAFTIIEKALAQVGAGLEDIVRTRLFVRNLARDGEHISRAHGNVLGHVKPASSMVEVSRLVHDDILVLIEVDAIMGDF